MHETREETFLSILKHYDAQDTASMKRGELPMRSTELGFWGTSNMRDVYEWFRRMDFPPATRFIDLGCGDGRVVLIASLFVEASGVEYDEALIHTAQEAAQTLGIDVQLRAGKIEDENLRLYDILYMYADRNFRYLKEKLLEELDGVLYLYHDTYHPDYLTKGPKHWIGQIPIHSYTR